ncbi:MAG TPA: tripartite tricarboxylate transporter substrate-binding protein, partial [Bacillota bacterium]
ITLLLLTLAVACGSSQPANDSGSPATGTGASGESSSSGTGTYAPTTMNWLIPYSPGGGTDVLARSISQVMNSEGISDATFTFEYKPGGSGAVGLAYLIEELKGNDYTLFPVVTSVLTSKIKGDVPYSHRDLTLLARLGLDPNAILVSKSSPFQTIQDLVEEGRKREILVGGTGVGGSGDIVANLLVKTTGISYRLVPFESGGELTTAMLGNQVDFIVNSPNESWEQIVAGEIRALAVTTEERLPDLPDVPTLRENGWDVVYYTFRGVGMPPGVSDQARTYWEEKFRALAESEAWQREYLAKYQIIPAYMPGDEFAKYLDEAYSFYEQQLQDLGLVKP